MDESSNQERILPDGRRRAGAVRRSLVAARRALTRHRAEVVCACLLLVMLANYWAVISRKSITNDEIIHIPAGYYHLVDGNFQFNNEHPPLAKMWSAIPLLFIQPDEPPREMRPAETYGEQLGKDFGGFWQANRTRFESIFFWTRAQMALLALLLGVVIFRFARELFGARAAMLAVALYTLEPNVLAHGRTVHTDLPAALGYTLFAFALYRYVRQPTARRAAWAAVACALAMTIKQSMIIAAPALGATLAALAWLASKRGERWSRFAWHGAVAASVGLLVINAAYFFDHRPLGAVDLQWIRHQSPELYGTVTGTIRALSNILPTYYLFGFYNIMMHNRSGHGASLLGMYRAHGWWYYFPVAFALKTTLPFLLLSLASLSWSIVRFIRKRDWKFAALLVPLALYAAFSMSSRINIGIRHFLPVFPFLFVMGGALLDRLLRRRRYRAASFLLVVAVLSLMAFEVARVFPNYMTYMNQLASRRPHWQYLSDSNVEWGDEVKELAKYLKARNETQVRAALSGAWVTLPFYGVQYIDIATPPKTPPPRTRYVAIGASFLNGSTVPAREENGKLILEQQRIDTFDAYRRRTPEAVFGDSIYLFREE